MNPEVQMNFEQEILTFFPLRTPWKWDNHQIVIDFL